MEDGTAILYKFESSMIEALRAVSWWYIFETPD